MSHEYAILLSMNQPSVERSVREQTKTAMWVGDMDEVRAFIRRLEPLVERSREDLRAHFNKTEIQRKAIFLANRRFSPETDADAEWDSENRRTIDDALERLEYQTTIKMKAYDEELEGDPFELLDEIDRPQEIAEISISQGRQGYSYRLPKHSGFRIVFDKYGANAVIFGIDRAWIDICKPVITRALGANRPRYHWMATWWGSVLVGYFPIMIAAVITVLLLAGSLRESPTLLLLVFVGYGIVLIGAMIFVIFGWGRLLPMFEVTDGKRSATGARALSLFGAGILWILASIVIPLLLNIDR